MSLLLLVLLTLAHAGGVVISIDAEVSEDLTRVSGTLRVQAPPEAGPVTLTSPFADFPEAADDRTLFRTWKGRARPGAMRAPGRHTPILPLELGPDGTIVWPTAFSMRLPRDRYGDLGAWKDRALFANGAWYPHVSVDGQTLPVVHWEVTVRLPEGTVGAVGDTAGDGVLRWSGEGERVSLAVLRGGALVQREIDGQTITLLCRRHRRACSRSLPGRLASLARIEPAVVVLAPLRRRLARPGVGLLYLSDRAWRLTPGLARYHDRAVTRGLTEASLHVPDPFDRALAAALLTRLAPTADARGLLKWFSWNPVIDAILNDRRMPFWADVLQAAHPEDPLRDDLVERYDPHGPTAALAAQLALVHPPEALARLAEGLARREGLKAAAERAGIDVERLESWRRAYPEQDLELEVGEEAVVVTRAAPDDAPAEIVEVRIGGESVARELPVGSDTIRIPTDGRPGRVVVDPGGLIRQTSRVGDAWPPRLVVLGAAWIDAINVTEGFISGHAVAWARGRDDNRNTAMLWAQADQQSLPAITLGWQHRRGPLQDGIARPHRFTLSATTAWSNPAFADGDEAVMTVEGGLGYAWDTRVSSLFPVRGRSLSVGISGGLAPAEATRWGRAGASALGLVSPHPRWAMVGRVSGAVATGDTRQRLLWLGGSGAGVSLTPGVEIGTRRGVVQGELRWAPIRQASVPLLWLAWLSEVQLTAGVEGVVLRTVQDTDAGVIGLTAGLAAIADLGGANPGLAGVTVGLPAVVQGVTDEDGQPVPSWRSPQVVLRFGQAF